MSCRAHDEQHEHVTQDGATGGARYSSPVKSIERGPVAGDFARPPGRASCVQRTLPRGGGGRLAGARERRPVLRLTAAENPWSLPSWTCCGAQLQGCAQRAGDAEAARRADRRRLFRAAPGVRGRRHRPRDRAHDVLTEQTANDQPHGRVTAAGDKTQLNLNETGVRAEHAVGVRRRGRAGGVGIEARSDRRATGPSVGRRVGDQRRRPQRRSIATGQ
jgi:hypothetical protein